MYVQLAGTSIRLLGSMHLFAASSPRMPVWIDRAFDWAESLVFESDAGAFLPLLRQPEDTALEQWLGPERWNQLARSWPSEGALAPLRALKPWAVLIAAPMLCQRVVEGVEPRLQRRALGDAKSWRYLESAEEIAASLEAIPLATIRDGLATLLADPGEPQRTLEQMQAAWLQRDLAALWQIASATPLFGLPGLREAILDARNRAWAPRIRALAQAPGRTLVVIGALHLCGADSLLTHLQHPVEAVDVVDAGE